MKRSRIPIFEPLEGKILLTIFAPDLLPDPSNSSMGLVVRLKTNRPVYRPGQSVSMTLTETNTSRHDITVSVGPSIDGFFVTQNGAEVWASNAGNQPQIVTQRTIKPGQSIRFQAVWNGHSNPASDAIPTGTLIVQSQVLVAHPVVITVRPARAGAFAR